MVVEENIIEQFKKSCLDKGWKVKVPIIKPNNKEQKDFKKVVSDEVKELNNEQKVEQKQIL